MHTYSFTTIKKTFSVITKNNTFKKINTNLEQRVSENTEKSYFYYFFVG